MSHGPEGCGASLQNSYIGALEFRRQVAGVKKLLEAELASLRAEPNAVGALKKCGFQQDLFLWTLVCTKTVLTSEMKIRGRKFI